MNIFCCCLSFSFCPLCFVYVMFTLRSWWQFMVFDTFFFLLIFNIYDERSHHPTNSIVYRIQYKKWETEEVTRDRAYTVDHRLIRIQLLRKCRVGKKENCRCYRLILFAGASQFLSAVEQLIQRDGLDINSL